MIRFLKISCCCLLLVALWSCSLGERQITQKPSSYYNIDSLLTASVEACLQEAATVTVDKQVTIDGEVEEKTLTMDSAALAEEVEFFRMLDINQPNLTFSYDATVSDDVIAYNLKAREEQEGITYLNIRTKNDQVIVDGEFVEKNSLYYTNRKMRIGITAGCLKYYQVAGKQKMTFKDTVNYTLKGAILD